jgi:hypothetical protein
MFHPPRLVQKCNRGRIIECIHCKVPECLSLHRNWVPPPPPPKASVSSLLGPMGEQHSLAGEGVGGGGDQCGRLDRKPGTLCTLCFTVLLPRAMFIGSNLSWPFYIKFLFGTDLIYNTVSWRIRIFNCIEEVPRFFFPIEFNSAFQISNYLQLNSTPYTI